MDIIKTIRKEIERLKKEELTRNSIGVITGSAFFVSANELLSFLDTLQEQDRPDPYNPTYDEAYLNEKITKASKTWKGVDVDKYMDEVRGRESETPMNQEELEDEMDRFFETMPVIELENIFEDTFKNIARHFAKWGADHTPLPEDTVIFNKGVEEGKRLMREEAVECDLYYDGDFLAIDLNMAELGYSERDKVRIIVLPNTDEK